MIARAAKMDKHREWHSLNAGRAAGGPMVQLVASNIRKVREMRGLSQAELGEKMGVTKSVVSKYERGDHTIGVEKLAVYAAALDVHVAFLLLRDPESAMIVDSGRTFFFKDR